MQPTLHEACRLLVTNLSEAHSGFFLQLSALDARNFTVSFL